MAWPNVAKGRSTLPRDWHIRRRKVLTRDGYACRIRLPGCTGKATDVDHVGDRDDHELTNLQAACGYCHRKKTSSQGVAKQARLRALRKRPVERHPGAPRVEGT